MGLLTKAALQGYREYTKRTIAYAKYKIGSTYYKANIEEITMDSSGTVTASFKIETKDTGSVTVTEIQLYDQDNQLWLSKAENLNMASVAEGFYYDCRFTIEEKV
jgi:hypothetical protein